jgi:hypothetical protein
MHNVWRFRAVAAAFGGAARANGQGRPPSVVSARRLPPLGSGWFPDASVHAQGHDTTMIKWLFLLVLAAAVGAVVFLATWDMPAPSATTEKVIPNDRFQ